MPCGSTISTNQQKTKQTNKSQSNEKKYYYSRTPRSARNNGSKLPEGNIQRNIKYRYAYDDVTYPVTYIPFDPRDIDKEMVCVKQ